MVDPIDKLSQAIAAMRARELALKRGQTRRDTTRATSKDAPPTTDRAAALKLAVARAVAAIDPTADDRRQRARRVFVEQVLEFEFGREIRMDRQFAALVKRVAADLTSDEASAAELDAQLDQLVKTLPPSRPT